MPPLSGTKQLEFYNSKNAEYGEKPSVLKPPTAALPPNLSFHICSAYKDDKLTRVSDCKCKRSVSEYFGFSLQNECEDI
jgi:hypothetical protein